MSDVKNILAKLQEHCSKNRIRITEFFLDFDKLRAGIVTRDQFKRCINMLGMVNLLNAYDYDVLFRTYSCIKEPSKVIYTQFCDVVDSVFTLKHMERNPTTGTVKLAPQGKRPNSTLTPEQWEAFAELMKSFIDEAISRGLILKEFFRDFDVHSCGRVTQTQFQRCFPFRLDPGNISIVAQRYLDPATQDVNYLTWVHDVEDGINARRTVVTVPAQSRRPESRHDHDINSLLAELKRQVMTNRIRIDEVFRDFDKLRSELITETQFASGIGSLKFQKMTLQPKHIQLLVDHYAVQDSYGKRKVAYTRFIDNLDSVFTEKGLEKNPLKSVQQPVDLLVRAPNLLTPPDERRVVELLEHIRGMIKTRRILLKPFFQDFDRANKGVYQTQTTTRGRFERALAYVGIDLTAADFKLLCDKYQVAEAGSVSDNIAYPAFCKDVDPMYSERPQQMHTTILPTHTAAAAAFIPPGKTGRVTIQEVEEDIQTHCLTNRVRVHEYFRDFDALRSGLVSRAQFATALTITGLRLPEPELALLCDKYHAPGQQNAVRWLAFANNIDEVFTTKQLEKAPTHEGTTMQRILTKKTLEAEPTVTADVQAVLTKVYEIVGARGILLPQFFQDFDKHNVGRISPSQFHQALSRHQFNLGPDETALLVASYKEPRTRDVNYRRFIRDVDIGDARLRGAAQRPASLAAGPRANPVVTLPALISNLQAQVLKTRTRVKDFFADADRLRKGYIARPKFRSGLDMSGLQFNAQELQLLETEFNNPTVPDTINHVQFLKVLDNVPSGQEMAFSMRAPPGMAASEDDPVMEKVRTRIKTRRTNPKPYFQDFDKIRKERVTVTQFASVMDKMQLALFPNELDVIARLFSDGQGNIDYISFCQMVEPAII